MNHDDKELLTPDRVGAELTRLRAARGWSQQKLADELGYTERYIGQLERGTKSPTLRTIADIAETFATKPSPIPGRRGAAASNHLENGVDSIKDHGRTPKRGFADLSGRGMADSQIVREFGDSRLYGKLRAFR